MSGSRPGLRGWLPPDTGTGAHRRDDRPAARLLARRPFRGPFWWLSLVVVAATVEGARLMPARILPGAAVGGGALCGVLMFGAAMVLTERWSRR